MEIKAVPIKEIYNSHNGYQVVLFRNTDTSQERFLAKGSLLPVNDKVAVVLHGNFKETLKYGLQFHVDYYEEVIPTEKNAIAEYLVAAKIRHVGKATARKIVDKFGDATFDILDHYPERVTEVRGISKKSANELIEDYNSKKNLREITMLLNEYMIPVRKLAALTKRFRDDLSKIKEIFEKKPYMLCTIEGITVKMIDDALKKKGCFNPKDYLRLCSYINHALLMNEACGNLYFTPNDMLDSVYCLLNRDSYMEEVSKDEIKAVINRCTKQNNITFDNGVIYRNRAFETEYDCAVNITKLLKFNLPAINVDGYIGEAEQEFAISLDETQKNAVRNVFWHNVSIITGGPGKGKTTILKVILYIQERIKKDSDIVLCAPTGKASRRMAESTGEAANTMHKEMGLTDDGLEPEGMLEADLFVADEFSMTDQFLAAKLFGYIAAGTRTVLVGDMFQLPSVRAGNVFKELIECGIIPVTVLSKVYRQEAGNSIIENADKINNGCTELVYDDHTVFIPCSDDSEIVSAIVQKIFELKSKYQDDDIEVLTPLRRKTDVASENMNKVLQKVMNPEAQGKNQLSIGSDIWREQDKVMFLKNEDTVNNGDTGRIIAVSREQEIITVEFDNGEKMDYPTSELEKLMLSYAITIHKSQGSEYPAVLIPLSNSYNSKSMMKRNLIYTAVTRAKNEVYLIGSAEMLAYAIEHTDINKRRTMLGRRIRELHSIKDGEVSKSEMNRKKQKSDQIEGQMKMDLL